LDSFAVARIDTASFTEKNIIARRRSMTVQYRESAEASVRQPRREVRR